MSTKNSPEQTKLSQRIALAIKEIGETNSSIAQCLGVDKNTISAYKHERGDPKGKVLAGLARYYGFNPKWLLTGEGEMFRQEPTESDHASSESLDLDRYDLIHRFENQDLAKKIALNLLEIEKLDKDGLKSISDKTEGLLEGLRLSSEKARRQLEQLAKSTSETVEKSLRQLSNAASETVEDSLRQLSNTTSEMANAPLKKIRQLTAKLIRENIELKQKLAESEARNRDPDMTTTQDAEANES